MSIPVTQATLSLAFQAATLQLAGNRSADPAPIRRVTFHLVQGFCLGFQGASLTTSLHVRSSADPIPREWEAFLRGVRTKELGSRGRLNEGAEACADAFLAGALEVFPEAEEKIFLKTLRRVWGGKMSPVRSPLPLPVSPERLEFSKAIGRHGGKRLRADYEAGLLGGWGKTVLDHKLHLRNVDEHLEASGWLLGTIAALKDGSAEESGLLARNHASVVYRAFHAGHATYPEEAAKALPSLLRVLDREIARWKVSDPDAAQALQANRDSVVNRALHSGDMKYPEKAVGKLPAMLDAVDRHIALWETDNAEAAEALRSNRASIVSRALNRGNFRYPEEAIKRLPELFATLDREIARLNPDVSKTARILEANRATIVMRALANGDFHYPEKVVKELPKLRRALEREIARLAASDPEAAQALRNNRQTVIDRTLNSGNLKITGR